MEAAPGKDPALRLTPLMPINRWHQGSIFHLLHYKVESLLVGNTIGERTQLMQIMIEQALQNCEDGDSSGIPFPQNLLCNLIL